MKAAKCPSKKEFPSLVFHPERIDLLNKINFEFDATKNKGYSIELDAKWMVLYTRLVSYHKEHNSTLVPQKYKEDPQLGRWVSNQRYIYKKKKTNKKAAARP